MLESAHYLVGDCFVGFAFFAYEKNYGKKNGENGKNTVKKAKDKKGKYKNYTYAGRCGGKKNVKYHTAVKGHNGDEVEKTKGEVILGENFEKKEKKIE